MKSLIFTGLSPGTAVEDDNGDGDDALVMFALLSVVAADTRGVDELEIALDDDGVEMF